MCRAVHPHRHDGVHSVGSPAELNVDDKPSRRRLRTASRHSYGSARRDAAQPLPTAHAAPCRAGHKSHDDIARRSDDEFGFFAWCDTFDSCISSTSAGRKHCACHACAQFRNMQFSQHASLNWNAFFCCPRSTQRKGTLQQKRAPDSTSALDVQDLVRRLLSIYNVFAQKRVRSSCSSFWANGNFSSKKIGVQLRVFHLVLACLLHSFSHLLCQDDHCHSCCVFGIDLIVGHYMANLFNKTEVVFCCEFVVSALMCSLQSF